MLSPTVVEAIAEAVNVKKKTVANNTLAAAPIRLCKFEKKLILEVR